MKKLLILLIIFGFVSGCESTKNTLKATSSALVPLILFGDTPLGRQMAFRNYSDSLNSNQPATEPDFESAEQQRQTEFQQQQIQMQNQRMINEQNRIRAEEAQREFQKNQWNYDFMRK